MEILKASPLQLKELNIEIRTIINFTYFTNVVHINIGIN